MIEKVGEPKPYEVVTLVGADGVTRDMVLCDVIEHNDKLYYPVIPVDQLEEGLDDPEWCVFRKEGDTLVDIDDPEEFASVVARIIHLSNELEKQESY